MKNSYDILGLLVEIVIPIGLLYKIHELYSLGLCDLSIIFLLLIAPLFVIWHWLKIRKLQLRNIMKIKLIFITGISILFTFSIVLGLSCMFMKFYLTGGSQIATEVAINEKMDQKGKLTKFESRFISDNISRSEAVYYLEFEKVKSELLIYTMLLLILIILYLTRYTKSHDCVINIYEP